MTSLFSFLPGIRRPRPASIGLLAFLLFAGCATVPPLDGPRQLEAQGRLVDALLAYERIEPSLSGEAASSARSAMARLRGEITDQVLTTIRQNGGRAETIPAVRAALDRLRPMLVYDDAARRLAAEKTTLEQAMASLQERYERALSAANTAAAARNWPEALAQLDIAEHLSGNAGPLAALRESCLSQRDNAAAVAIRAALQSRDLAQAESLFSILVSSKPPASAALVAQLKAETLVLRQARFLEEQQDLASKQRYYTAYKNLLSSEADFPAAKAYLATVRKDGAIFYRDVARREQAAEDNRRVGYAYFAAVKAHTLNPKDDGIFKLHRDLADAIEAYITIRIAVAGFDSPSNQPGLGAQVSDALITYLVDHLPHGIKVIERSKTDKALQAAAQDVDRLGRDLDLELVIVGNVSSLSIERKRFEREVTEIVQVGMRKEPNPLYGSMVAKYGPSPASWPNQVPPLIDGAPNMETVRYKQGEEVLNGVMVAYLRSFETARGVVTLSREFTATENHKDLFRDAVPSANITYDPLELPTDNEVRERLRANLVAQVSTVLLETYADREQRYLRESNAHLERRELDLALLNLAAAHHYSTIAGAIAGGRAANASVARIDHLGLVELTE